MLNWVSKPDEVFNYILTQAFEYAIEDLSSGDSTKGESAYFDKRTIKIFGGCSGLLYELERLKIFHESPDVFMPSDYHFLILDRMLTVWVEIYNEIAEETLEDPVEDPEMIKSFLIMYKDQPIKKIEMKMIAETFFWDDDYDYDPKAAMALEKSPDLLARVDMSQEAINASIGRPPDARDLRLSKVTPQWCVDESFDWIDEGLYNDV